MIKKFIESFETIGSVGWLVMDFCWMSRYTQAVWFVIFVPLTFLPVAILISNKENLIERMYLISSFFWFLMNLFWMFYDFLGEKEIFLSIAKIFFIFASLSVSFGIFLSRKEKRRMNYNRIKID